MELDCGSNFLHGATRMHRPALILLFNLDSICIDAYLFGSQIWIGWKSAFLKKKIEYALQKIGRM